MSEEVTSTETPSESAEATTVSDSGETIGTTSFLDGKYDSISALESGYKELQSSYSSKTAEYSKAMGGRIGAPEAYEYNEGISVSDGMEAYAREQGYSNDALNELAGAYQADMETQGRAYADTQREALGKDAQTRLDNVSDWARANFGEDNMDTFNSMVTSAAGVEMFEKLAKMNQGTQAAAVAQPRTMVDKDTVNAMRFENDRYGNRRMASDPTFRAKVEAMEAELIGNGGKL